MPGALLLPVVYQHSPWIHKPFYPGRGSGFLRDCLRGGVRVPKLASLPTPWVKGSFHIFLFKTQRFFMLDNRFLKVKPHPMRSSGFHGICRIKVIMVVFLVTCRQKVKKKRRKIKTTEQVLALFLNVCLIKYLCISQLSVRKG